MTPKAYRQRMRFVYRNKRKARERGCGYCLMRRCFSAPAMLDSPMITETIVKTTDFNSFFFMSGLLYSAMIYFWFLLFGLSGMVISILPDSNGGLSMFR